MSLKNRLKAHWWIIFNSNDAITRRVAVENYLLKASKGQVPLPDESKCKELAMKLGVPTSWGNKS